MTGLFSSPQLGNYIFKYRSLCGQETIQIELVHGDSKIGFQIRFIQGSTTNLNEHLRSVA